MTEPEPLTAAGRALLSELAESPLPGARYALDVVWRRIRAIEEAGAAAERAIHTKALGWPPTDDDERPELHLLLGASA